MGSTLLIFSIFAKSTFLLKCHMSRVVQCPHGPNYDNYYCNNWKYFDINPVRHLIKHLQRSDGKILFIKLFHVWRQGLYIGYDSISVLSQSVSLLQVYLLLELSSSSLLAGTGGNRRRPAATSPLVFSVVRLT